MDQPAVALLRDLKERGLPTTRSSSTTGRMPSPMGRRDHNGGTLFLWFAGGIVRIAHGRAISGPGSGERATTCYDFHATILHLLGIDHTRLTFRHNGTTVG